MASKLRQEFSKFNLKDDTPCPARKAFRTDPLVLGKVVLRPDTTLDKTKVCQFLVGVALLLVSMVNIVKTITYI